MTHDERKNLRKLSLVRGGLYGTRSQCQRDVQANVYALRAARQQKGRVMPWGIHTVAEGKTAPTGEPEKLMDRLKRVGCSLPEVYRAVMVPQIRELYAKYGQDYDEPHAA